MEIIKRTNNSREEILITSGNIKYIMGWYGSDLYWIMPNYVPNNRFNVTCDTPYLWEFLEKLFKENHFKNNTFIWISEARLEKESSFLKITKGKNSFNIRFIQGENDYLAKVRNICPICFCLSGSRKQEIANSFSNLLHKILNQGL